MLNMKERDIVEELKFEKTVLKPSDIRIDIYREVWKKTKFADKEGTQRGYVAVIKLGEQRKEYAYGDLIILNASYKQELLHKIGHILLDLTHEEDTYIMQA